MNLKYLFSTLFLVVALFTSCSTEEQMTLLDEIQVSSSTIALPEEGGATEITLKATGNWTIAHLPKWLSVSPLSGNAGEMKVRFSAEATQNGRAADTITIESQGVVQHLRVIQGLPKVETVTAKQASEGIDGKIYRIAGTVTAIENTVYGNWTLVDKTGSIYIYGTLDKKNNTKNFASLGLEEGDEVVIEGPRSVYKGTPQLVNVSVVSINKSLIKVDSVLVNNVKGASTPKEGGEYNVYLTNKAQAVSVVIPDDAKSWLSMTGIESKGTGVIVTFKATANEGGVRTTTLTFRTSDGKKDYSSTAKLTQKGGIVNATVAEFTGAPESTIKYRVSGVITRIDAGKPNFYFRDFSGETYVYKLADFDAQQLKVNDIVTLIGTRSAYKGTPQMVSATVESVKRVTKVTIAELLAKPDSNKDYYAVEATIDKIKKGAYGNMNLSDETGTVYLYGCYPGWGAAGDARKGLVKEKGIKAGDTVTVIGTKMSYNGTPQIAHGIYVSHVSK